MRCFRCHSKDHLIAKCPYDSDDENAIKKKRKKQKKKQEKKESSHKKKNNSHIATWDSDDSSSDDEDDNKSKKGHASIAIQEKVSFFDTPSCFVAKTTKVSSYDESDHDNASDSDSNKEEFTKNELITMLEDCTQHFKEFRKECKGLLKEKKNLMQELDEFRASYESLKIDHKKLQKSHTKLEETHSSLVEKCENISTNVEKAKTCNIGISCDIIDESFHNPIVIAPTNPSCSSSTSSSSSSDCFTCDSTLIVENENIKKEVKELNHTLAKAYGGEDRLLMCLDSQRASLYKEGLGYNPKKGKTNFAPHKTRFVKNNGSYCKSCKQVGHIEQFA
jgi:FtsZ-binding cell division protein ZapB